MIKRIQAKINNNDRFKIAEEKMISDVKTEANFKEDKLSLKRFSTALDETFFTYKWTPPTYEKEVKLFELDGTEYSLSDFANFSKTNVRERLKYNKTKTITHIHKRL